MIPGFFTSFSQKLKVTSKSGNLSTQAETYHQVRGHFWLVLIPVQLRWCV